MQDWQGETRHGVVRPGESMQARRDTAWPGEAGPDLAGRCRRGETRHGEVRRGESMQGRRDEA